MRKVLNILQATSMAHGDVTLKAVYLTTGTPLPSDLEALFGTLMQAPFAEALKVLETLRVEKGYSLADLLRGVFDLSVEIQMPAPAEIEHRLSRGATEKVQAAALVGVFIEVREI